MSKDLLDKLYKKMHNWWEIKVVYEHEDNKDPYKIWEYKDCTGITLRSANRDMFEDAIRKLKGLTPKPLV